MSTSQSGRAVATVLVLVALAAVAFLLLAHPFGGGSGEGSGAGGSGGPPDLLGAEGLPADGDGPDPAAATLGGRYGEGDMGAVRVRLLWVGTREPVAGQAVELVDRRGVEAARQTSGADGVVWFTSVRPARSYQLHLSGEGFSEVWMKGFSVFPQATADLGDLVLGQDVVLRGRVVDALGRPVPGTAVSVHTIERRLATKGMLVYLAEQAGSVPLPLSEVESDAEGYFAFASLADGTYSLVARHGGFASRHEADVIVARKRGAGVLTIVLGQAGKVTGRVTDPQGKPVGGAQVIAIRDVRQMTTNVLQREVALTDASGRYAIDTLTRGERYRCGVVAEGYAPVYEVASVEVGREDVEKDFVLVKGGNLEGVVTDEATGKPVEGARIAVYVGPMGFGGRQRGVDADARAAADVRRSDEQGHFVFEALNPGPVASAVVQAPGYVSASFSVFPPPGNAWPDVVAEQTTQVQVALKRGGAVRGHVLDVATKAPIQGAEVTLMQTGWMAMASMWIGTPTALSGADGSYELQGVTPGTYRLLAAADGYSALGGAEGVEVKVPEGGDALERDLTLTSAGVVEGTVTNLEGEPVAGVRVRLRSGPAEGAPAGAADRGMRRGLDFARQMLLGGQSPVDLTDDQGRFRLEGVGSEGLWVVRGESEEYVGAESKPFKVGAGEVRRVDLQMLPGGSLRGTVVDENGRRLPGVRVQVGHLDEDLATKGTLTEWEARQALGQHTTASDEEGRFFVANLEPGRTMVRASHDGYVTFFKRNVTLAPGQAYENYTVALSRGEVLEGTVQGPDGRAVAGATISVTTQQNPSRDGNGEDTAAAEPSEDVEPTMWARTDAAGHFRIENIKPASYSVVVWFAPGFKGWMRDSSEAAIHRGVSIPAPPQEFRLEAADPQEAPAGFPGRRGPR